MISLIRSTKDLSTYLETLPGGDDDSRVRFLPSPAVQHLDARGLAPLCAHRVKSGLILGRGLLKRQDC